LVGEEEDVELVVGVEPEEDWIVEHELASKLAADVERVSPLADHDERHGESLLGQEAPEARGGDMFCPPKHGHTPWLDTLGSIEREEAVELPKSVEAGALDVAKTPLERLGHVTADDGQ
jgi:hypothetical protein